MSLDIALRKLQIGSQSVAVGARAFDVLVALAQAGGELLTKDQLLQLCWPGLVVEESNIHVQVSQLRKLLPPEAIATVPGLGYRLAWPVRPTAAHAAPNNLPSPRTSFVGRELLLDKALSRLRDTRLLTLIGIGGTGKTRLALHLAARMLGEFAEGVWWVDLASLDRTEQVAAAVAQVLGVAPRDGRDPAQVLTEWIRVRRLLLVLDNCEHLLDAVAAWADRWLAAAPGLRLLVTSREALGLAGEVVLPVPPLTLPSAAAPAAEVLDTEAVRLFVDRAALAAPGWCLAESEAPTLAEICRRVDGIPLALELAAAQLRVVAPAQLLDLLHERFRLLSSQRRALPRQQTMQTVIAWSYEHLSDDERRLLQALAICSDGCDLAAVAALMGPELPQVALLASLSRLADQSLLVVRHGAGAARYYLLETVRQFGFERLQDSDLGPLLRARHVKHYLMLAERCAEQIARTGYGAAPMAQLDLERENLLRVADCCANGDVPDAATDGLRLLIALRRYWLSRGLAGLGLSLGLAVLGRAESLSATQPFRYVLASVAYLLWWAGRLDEAHAAAQRLERLARAADDTDLVAAAQLEMGTVLRRQGRIEDSLAEHENCCRTATMAGNLNVYGDALCRMGHTELARGRFEEALKLQEQAIPIRRASGTGWRIAGSLLYAAHAAIKVGSLDRAHAWLAEAVVLLPHVGSAQYDLFLLDYAAQLAGLRGQWPVLVRIAATLQALQAIAGPPMSPDEQTWHGAVLQQARGELDDAAFDTAWTAGAADKLPQAVAFVAQWLGPPANSLV